MRFLYDIKDLLMSISNNIYIPRFQYAQYQNWPDNVRMLNHRSKPPPAPSNPKSIQLLRFLFLNVNRSVCVNCLWRY